jgi:hypothetical protein
MFTCTASLQSMDLSISLSVSLCLHAWCQCFSLCTRRGGALNYVMMTEFRVEYEQNAGRSQWFAENDRRRDMHI